MTMQTSETSGQMVRIACGGEVVMATEATWEAVADDLFAKHGTVPRVDRVGEEAPASEPPHAPDTIPAPPASEPAPAAIVALPAPPPMPRGLRMLAPDAELVVSAEGKTRSQADFDAAVRAGFTPRQPLFERGTRVVQMGVDNARKFRAEFDAMPTTREGCAEFIAAIAAEKRGDADTEVRSMRMTDSGAIVYFDAGQEVERPLTQTAFASMCSRLGFGGAQYLGDKCWPTLRAHNVNEQLARMNGAELVTRQDLAMKGKTKPEWRQLRMREREAAKGGREVYGVVTDSYTAWDVDKVAEAIRLAAPEDARGRVTYDGEKARFEVLFHSTVQPEHYVAGEFFRAGVIIDTDDTGGGSLGGSSTVHSNLCLNLVIIDRARQGLFRIRHIGSLDALVTRFRAGFAAALDSLEHFRKAWGYAVEQDAVTQALKAAEEPIIPVSQALPGLFRGIIERELVPVFARTEDAIPKLMKMWERDQSSAKTVSEGSRAAIVNAATRYAHEAVELDAWQEDAIARAAGELVYSKKPLPYQPEPTKK